MDNEIKREGGFHYAWVILVVATFVLGVYVPVVNSLSNSWKIAITADPALQNKNLGSTLNVFSMIEGGVQFNSVPDKAV